ncbi:MAG: T9SS type A sorting domain-containing protein [Bacteroidota bacterium]
MKTKSFILATLFLLATVLELDAQWWNKWSKTSMPNLSYKKMFICENYSYYGYNLYALTDSNKVYRMYTDFNDDETVKLLDNLSDSIEYTSIYADDNRVFVGTNNQGLFYSTDKGESWFHYIDSNFKSLKINSVTIFDHYNKNLIYCGTSKGLYFSSDSGKHFEKYNDIFANKEITEFFQDGYFVSTSDSNLYLWSDIGKVWLNRPLYINSQKCKRIVKYSINTGSEFSYLATDSEVFKSGYGLDSIKIIEDIKPWVITGLISFQVYGETLGVKLKQKSNPKLLSPGFYGPGYCIATKDSGIYVFSDYSEPMNNGLKDKRISCIASRGHSGSNLNIYAATLSDGVYRNEIYTLSVDFSPTADTTISVISTSSDLLRIKFNLQNYSPLKLEFYDMLGNRVADNSWNSLSEGSQYLDINISNIPAGLYFIKLTTNEKVAVKKFLITR